MDTVVKSMLDEDPEDEKKVNILLTTTNSFDMKYLHLLT